MTLAAITETLDALQRWLETATTLDWALLGLAVAIIWLVWRSAAAGVRLGTIEVGSGDAEKSSDFGRKETAALRHELAEIGLVPSGGVPSGSPKAGVVAAVQAAPVSQAEWLGTLLEAIPTPPSETSFKVTATLWDASAPPGSHDGKEEADGAVAAATGVPATNGKGRDEGDAESKSGVRLAYQVLNASTGESIDLDTIAAVDAQEAINHAARAIYRAIQEYATGIFPPWSRWPGDAALDEYLKGGAVCADKGWAEAIRHYLCAESLAPSNMLVLLGRANALEREFDSRVELDKQIGNWICALVVYFRVIDREKSIFEAHYRSSVLLSRLADNASDITAEQRRALTGLLEVRERSVPADPDGLVTAMRGLARSELRIAKRRLAWWWTLWDDRRLRHRFELRGRERSQTKRALAISRLTLLTRKQWTGGEVQWGRFALRRYLWRTQLRLRMSGRWDNAGWQAHYNAACFYAVQPEAAQNEHPLPDTRFLQNRAFDHLVHACRDPDAQLDQEYVRHHDPDLQALRDAPRWSRFVDAIFGREIVIHYRRPQAPPSEYQNWGLHVWGDGVRESAVTTWESPLRPTAVDGPYGSIFRVPLSDDRKPVSFILHKGPEKDIAEEREITVGAFGVEEVWLLEGDKEVYRQAPHPGARAASAGAPK